MSTWPDRPSLEGLSRVPAPEDSRFIASALRGSWGFDDLARFDSDAVLQHLGIECRESNLGGGEGGPQGLLMPLADGGFRIEVDPSPPEGWRGAPTALREEVSRHRRRFTIAHELAHTLFYWRGGSAPERVAKDSAAQEIFCDALASALLVPPAAAEAMSLHPESVIALHRAYDVSIEVAARALVHAHRESVGWVVICPPNAEEPWVQWGAERSSDAVGPWRALLRIAERVKESDAVAQARLRWRSGGTTLARGLFLTERNQLVVIARAA